jgi:hypothetical protein
MVLHKTITAPCEDRNGYQWYYIKPILPAVRHVGVTMVLHKTISAPCEDRNGYQWYYIKPLLPAVRHVAGINGTT